MTEKELFKMRFPLGKNHYPEKIERAKLHQWILLIEAFPTNLVSLISGLSKEQLNWTYRPGGWSIKQLVHHCSDSHVNAFIRLKLSLTEDIPNIRPYREDKWAQLPDSKNTDLSHSLQILHGIHAKWVSLLNSLSDSELNRKFFHPEENKTFNLKEHISDYAWHCQHHLKHIENAINSKGRYND